MTSVILAALVATTMYALHRLALWMEDRGWIYYRKRRGSSGVLGAAFLELQSIYEPGRRYVLEEIRSDEMETQDSGDPPDAGSVRN